MEKHLKPVFKKPNDFEKLHPEVSEEGKEEMPTRRMGVFCKNIGITHNIYFKEIILKLL